MSYNVQKHKLFELRVNFNPFYLIQLSKNPFFLATQCANGSHQQNDIIQLVYVAMNMNVTNKYITHKFESN